MRKTCSCLYFWQRFTTMLIYPGCTSRLPDAAVLVLVSLFVAYGAESCKSPTDIPFPADREQFSQPLTGAVKFTEPEPITWADSTNNIIMQERALDYDKLPSGFFDSSGFRPFPKRPMETAFDWNALPYISFDYEKLPSKPLEFKSILLPPPPVIKIGRPVLKKSATELLYELGEPITGKSITGIIKDKNGFLWIIAQDNVYRYNGEELTLYLQLPNSTSIVQDKNGRIWAASNAGLVVMIDTKVGTINYLQCKNRSFSRMMCDRQNRIWLSSQNSPGDITILDLPSNTVKELTADQGFKTGKSGSWGMLQDENDNIWIGTRNGGINIIDVKNKKLSYFTKENGLLSDSISGAHFVIDNEKKIWVATPAGGIQSIEPKKGIITKYTWEQGLKKDGIPAMALDGNGRIVVATQGIANGGAVLELIDPVKERLKKIESINGLSAGNLLRLLQDANGCVWIGTSSGVNLLRQNSDYTVHRVGSKDISTQFQEPGGRIWTGFLYDGMQIKDTSNQIVKYITTTEGLSNNQIQSIVYEYGKLYVATTIAVDVIDLNAKKIQRLGQKEGLKNAPSTIIKTSNGKIIINSNTAGLQIFDPVKMSIIRIDSLPGIVNSIVSAVLQDKKGNIWIAGTISGIACINIENNTLKRLENVDALKNTGGEKLFVEDGMGNIWIGTTGNGIFVINADRDSVTNITYKNGLLNGAVISLISHNGKIYAGNTLGLNIITPSPDKVKKWKIESLGKSDGIQKQASSLISDLITQKGEYWWGDKGITIIENPGEPFKDTLAAPPTYISGISIQNRLQNFRIDPWTTLNANDTLRVPDQDSFYLKGNLPPNAFSDNTGNLTWDSLTGKYNLPENLRMPFGENYIQVHFAQMDAAHRNSDTIWYRYILEGIDKKWSEKTFNHSSENYVNLQPGLYTFKAASEFNGKWSEPVSFQFTVLPPWWRTWWAYLIYLAVFAYLIRAFIRYRSRWLEKENRILEEKVTHRTIQLNKTIEELKSTQTQLIQSEKMASLGELTAGIAHEIQNPLNFVNNFSEVNAELIDELEQEINKGNLDDAKLLAKDIKDNEQKINHHGKRADAIVKGMLQHSRSSSGQREPTDINALTDEYLRLSYHGLRAKDKTFNATTKTDFDGSIGKINIVSQDIGRAILNLITNAFYAVTEKKKQQKDSEVSKIKYEPTVMVRTEKINGKVEIRIKDNGNGVPKKVLEKIFQPFFTTKPAGQGTGLGLSLSYDIVKAHGGELKVETKEGEGAEFIIILPQ